MKPLTGLPVDSLVQVASESGMQLKELHELVQQIENGATPAFLARYRADLCGGMSEELVLGVLQRLRDTQDLIDRRISMVAALGRQGVLTEDLKARLEGAKTRRELNDIYLPYRARGRDAVQQAVDKGLDPLARVLWYQQDGVDILAEAAKHVGQETGLVDPEQALAGAYEIAGRWLSEKPEILRDLRKLYHRECELSVAVKEHSLAEPRWQALNGYRAKAHAVPWQKRLLIRRGVRSGILDATMAVPSAAAAAYLEHRLIQKLDSSFAPHLRRVAEAALRGGLSDQLKKDVLRQIDDQTDQEAIQAFRKNLRDAILSSPALGLNIVGLETSRPGGWRAALINARGELVECALIDPEKRPPRDEPAAVSEGRPAAAEAQEESGVADPAESVEAAKAEEPQVPDEAPAATPADRPKPSGPEPESAAAQENEGAANATMPGAAGGSRNGKRPRREDLTSFLRRHDIDLIVFPSGPRPRSTERVLRTHIRRAGKNGIAWRTVRDPGTWIYATSKVGKQEFPKLDPSLRSAISLARRAQDPMSELVKADPKTVGIGLNYQEINPERLSAALRETIECAVHDVGVDLNRATVPLLSLVPGFTLRLAWRVVEHRAKHGPFQSRDELRKVEGISHRVFLQAVGFLRVQGNDPFDNTGAHPDFRELHERIAESVGCDLITLLAEPERLEAVDPEQFATAERSVECIRSAIREMQPERRDVRGKFELPQLAVPLRSDEELTPGTKVHGVVKSVADFGVFVDIGADKDALLHVSQIQQEHKQNSKPTFRLGDSVQAFVRNGQQNGKGISLSMWDPSSRPPRERNGSGRTFGSPQQRDGGGRRNDRRPPRGDRRKPFSRTFGSDSGTRSRGVRMREDMSLEEKLEAFNDRYRTKA